MTIHHHGRGHEIEWLRIPDHPPETKHLLAATPEEAERLFNEAHAAPPQQEIPVKVSTKKPEKTAPTKPAPTAKRMPPPLTPEQRRENSEQMLLTKAVQGDIPLTSMRIETLLEAVELERDWLSPFHDLTASLTPTPRVSWIVVGGESSHGARPFLTKWARSLVRQCRAVRVPVFVKQLGAEPRMVDGSRKVVPLRIKSRKGADMSEWPLALRVREYPEAKS
jgi:hypothetical protein